jgi:hypothetical protein
MPTKPSMTDKTGSNTALFANVTIEATFPKRIPANKARGKDIQLQKYRIRCFGVYPVLYILERTGRPRAFDHVREDHHAIRSGDENE